eukprot:TRINITY_DN25015_c0_g1_i1.p1 TRINITY_DN25015_c0_g1~~TRINITY_DN25015_c0_g1_i1.p1  ORF type:complete len:502 (+),score=107.94 TRINITY_DN25015_c0_g1_i1:98-1603(+)
MDALRSSSGDGSQEVTVLDPYQCIAKCNRKYANECKEVYLTNKGATALSENFKVFLSLEVVWFNGNRLSRLDNLELNFRIREVYVQDNRLVSLAGIKSLKFLQVLLASNNQLRNLDKQLALLERFNFLQKLDLFDNPVGVEPDYRLRVIYQVPQVQQLDRRVITGPERLKADEVIPNQDKVSAPKPERPRHKGPQPSVTERDCFRQNVQIKERRRIAEEQALGGPFRDNVDHAHFREGMLNVNKAQNRADWGVGLQPPVDPRRRAARENAVPSPWERSRMKQKIIKMAGKEELTRHDVAQLAEDLADDGVEEVGDELRVKPGKHTMVSEVGRVLGDANVFKAKGNVEMLDKLFDGPEASVSVGPVADWLLSLEWPRADDSKLETRIRQHEVDYKWSHLGKDDEALSKAYAETLKASPEAMRLDGVRSCKEEVAVANFSGSRGLNATTRAASLTTMRDVPIRKHRADVFHQSFLYPTRGLDTKRGKVAVKASSAMRSTSLGG